jgi:hypothetical protein
VSKSNIFVYIELSKLVSNLSTNLGHTKKYLKSQAGYFNIITGKYFSDTLCQEWENIALEMKQKGPELDEGGRVKTNAFINTIDGMSPEQCVDIVLRITSLYSKVKLELEFAD